jgi:glycosyltransferase involved in cell wall biosynthesis
MKTLNRVAFIGNHLPRRCGIATFTHDLHLAIATARPALATSVLAMTDPGRSYEYPSVVKCEIHDDVIDDYAKAARYLKDSRADVVSLQHEYGIFGGPDGRDIDELLQRIELPIVTTLHTVLAEPSANQRDVLDTIIERSSKLIVMAEKGRELLRSVHGVVRSKIEVVPHGIPDFPFVEPTFAKTKLGFGGRAVILTFGLLSPSKGIESVIDAMPEIVKSCPTAVYVILGATHPNLVRQQGEAYRECLLARVQTLGIEEHVVFFNQFVDQPTLLDFISMCDVYVTPYLNEDQMTSGTLAYSFGLGKAVVSTPYWHAKELLGDGRGVLVPFGDSHAIGSQVTALLTNDVRRHAIRKRAYKVSRAMTWAETARRYLEIFDATGTTVHLRSSIARDIVRETRALPPIELGHFHAMCDDTGLLQHAVQTVPNRHHGYCIDDNARALLLSCALGRDGLTDTLTSRFAAFIQHAWNPDTERFRNFMSFDRRWLEDSGSEDSHGRTLWALAACAARDLSPARQRWATALFKTALPAVAAFESPRAWAFTLLGLDEYCAIIASDADAIRMRQRLADRLLLALHTTQAADWCWFEDSLAYDNARLPQALIVTGLATQHSPMLAAGLKSLHWLVTAQTTPEGLFRPVGTDSYGRKRSAPRPFDQQPLEAAATISACFAAWRATDKHEWISAGRRAFGWFVGDNDLGASLIDSDSGSCRDGLHHDRPNENCGAESVLSYLLALAELREFSAAALVPPRADIVPSLSRSA